MMKKHNFYIFVVVVFLLSFLYVKGAPTNNQKVFFKKYDIDDPEQWTQRFCRAIDKCQQYSEIRLECSTAGNFEKCVEVKSEEIRDFLYPYLCSDSGSVLTFDASGEKIPFTTGVLPTKLQCVGNSSRVLVDILLR